jgi:hypothetical protein
VRVKIGVFPPEYQASSMPKRDQDGKVHMHEYDDNWKCRCGFRLITESDPATAVVNIKAFVTPDGETVALRDRVENQTDATAKPAKKKEDME